ncbi:PLU-1-like domain protein [Leptospira sp. GIMC2001]|uniref:PLU-1-like domain protein n=1 Tax=Leptospira sp. GIMC2001 TaxID=1513297 RepID=UPI00234A38C7|nr:PLU-1-like domain protein [Leptospira sp. GIMC2001]WCL47833.1 PLU-1-like domain protein [Leptospira sp. GIMC2001]
MEYPELESYFQELTDRTDRIATMNTHFDANPKNDIDEMLAFHENLVSIPWDQAERSYFDLFCSYFSFHLKIVEEIIMEAREILDPENRPYVKQLVAYTKASEEWFNSLKKNKKKTIKAQVA